LNPAGSYINNDIYTSEKKNCKNHDERKPLPSKCNGFLQGSSNSMGRSSLCPKA
jgi:hypothetical protein